MATDLELDADDSDPMGECSKCGSEISTEVERCPQCGYEPSVGIGQRLGYLILIPIFAFSAFMILVSIIILLDGADLMTSAFSFIFFGVITAITGKIMIGIEEEDKKKPTE